MALAQRKEFAFNASLGGLEPMDAESHAMAAQMSIVYMGLSENVGYIPNEIAIE